MDRYTDTHRVWVPSPLLRSLRIYPRKVTWLSVSSQKRIQAERRTPVDASLDRTIERSNDRSIDRGFEGSGNAPRAAGGISITTCTARAYSQPKAASSHCDPSPSSAIRLGFPRERGSHQRRGSGSSTMIASPGVREMEFSFSLGWISKACLLFAGRPRVGRGSHVDTTRHDKARQGKAGRRAQRLGN